LLPELNIANNDITIITDCIMTNELFWYY